MNGIVLAILLSQQPVIIAEPPPQYQLIRVRSVKDAKIASLVLNCLSKNSTIVPPVLEGNMVRFNIRDYAPLEKDFIRWRTAWEELRFDPAFNVLAIINGKVNRQTLHAPELIQQFNSEAPVVDIDYFIYRALSTIKDQGGNSTIFGGLYYEFAGIEKTEVDQLKALGLGEAEDLLEFFNKLPSQRRTAQKKSVVSGKPRRIDFIATLAKFSGWVASTRDIEDGEQDGRNDPFVAIARMRVKAVETIFTQPNGLPGYALFDGQGNRQDEAPNKVVAADGYRDRNGDRNPHATRLQVLSCFDCHWSRDDSKGFLPIKNDILERQKKNIILNDPILKQLYQGDPLTPGEELHTLISRARDDLNIAVYKTTNLAGKGMVVGWPGDPEGKNTVRQMGQYLVKRYQEYAYEPINARDALVELNYTDVPEKLGDALAMFNKLVPLAVGENPDITDLRSGSELDRFHWSLIRAEVFLKRRNP